MMKLLQYVCMYVCMYVCRVLYIQPRSEDKLQHTYSLDEDGSLLGGDALSLGV